MQRSNKTVLHSHGNLHRENEDWKIHRPRSFCIIFNKESCGKQWDKWEGGTVNCEKVTGKSIEKTNKRQWLCCAFVCTDLLWYSLSLQYTDFLNRMCALLPGLFVAFFRYKERRQRALSASTVLKCLQLKITNVPEWHTLGAVSWRPSVLGERRE